MLMPVSRTPRPTWAGFVPPVAGVGAPAPERFWLSRSSKSTLLVLYPVVLTLAMLLPTTSMNAWCDRKPVTAANIERSIVLAFLFSDEVRLCLHVGDRAERNVLTADHELRPVRGHVDTGDETDRRVPVIAVLAEDCDV